MLNMVTAEELIPDEDYTDILEDIREECEKYGEVEDLEIPRPTEATKKKGGGGGEETKWAPKTGAEMAETREEKQKKDEDRGVGRVYVLFRTLEGAQKGVRAIAGRQFGGRVIICAGIDVVSLLPPSLFFVRSSFLVSLAKQSLTLSSCYYYSLLTGRVPQEEGWRSPWSRCRSRRRSPAPHHRRAVAF